MLGATGAFVYPGGSTSISGVKLKNALFVEPGDDLQVKYDWLASSDRDGVMGALSEGNKRHLIKTPGDYDGQAITGYTAYVYVVELVPDTTINAFTVDSAKKGKSDATDHLWVEGLSFALADRTGDATNHIQDICTDGTHIYSSWANGIAKHTLAGVLVDYTTTDVDYHTGGICYYDGKVYVAHSTSAIPIAIEIRAYNVSDLSLANTYDIFYDVSKDGNGIGAIAYHDGSFYVSNFNGYTPHDWIIYKYNLTFTAMEDKFIISKNRTESSYIETLERVGKYWMCNSYVSGRVMVIMDDDFNVLNEESTPSFALGCCSLGNDGVLRATQDGSYDATVHFMRLNSEKVKDRKRSASRSVIITGDGVAATFRIEHGFTLDSYSDVDSGLSVVPSNSVMAAMSYFINEVTSDYVGLTFTTVPASGVQYMFDLRLDQKNRKEPANPTITSPKTIDSLAELRTFRDAVNAGGTYDGADAQTGYFEVTANITLDGAGVDSDWTPIGQTATPFQGTFDGRDFIIDDLTQTSAVTDQGLFGAVTSGGIVRNIVMTNVSQTGTGSNHGAVAGRLNAAYVINCTSSGSVDGNSSVVGGLVGKIEASGYIKNSSSSCTVNGPSEVGGLVGSVNSSTVINSFATGAVTTDTTDKGGGLTGYTYNSFIVDCYATGSVTTTTDRAGGLVGELKASGITNSYYTTGTVTGVVRVGGLVGWVDAGEITDCYATGNAVSTGNELGGLVGRTNNAKINRSYSEVNVNGGAASDFVGGLVGATTTTTVIQNCYAKGTVDGDGYVGGLAGYLTSGSSIIDCHSMGAVTGNTDLGGLLGGNNACTITTSYYAEATGQADTGKGAKVLDVDYTTEGSFTGFDFTNIWEMGSSNPELQ
ncbi:MAG: hypothetical protein KAJ46_05365 [Sedimentisphaerales bacterium]|nr:hypothetical protein [Sedimentisphaerales bacterium]